MTIINKFLSFEVEMKHILLSFILIISLSLAFELKDILFILIFPKSL